MTYLRPAHEDASALCKGCGPTRDCLRCGQPFPHSRNECDETVAQLPGFRQAMSYVTQRVQELSADDHGARHPFMVHSDAADAVFEAGYQAARRDMLSIIE